MIVTQHAVAMYRDRVNPRATLPEAAAAIQPCEMIASYVRSQTRAQYRTRDAHVVCRGGRAVEVWPLSCVVSSGPMGGRV